MIRGIGDPLVACYARAYLCRVGMSLAPEIKTHLLPNFTDYLCTLTQVRLALSIAFSLYRCFGELETTVRYRAFLDYVVKMFNQ